MEHCEVNWALFKKIHAKSNIGNQTVSLGKFKSVPKVEFWPDDFSELDRRHQCKHGKTEKSGEKCL